MSDQGGIWTDMYIRRLEQRINETYEEAQRDIEAKLDSFQQRHAVKAAKQFKRLKNGEITQDQYNSWMKGQIFQGNQWEIKRDQIIGVLTNANSIATKISNEHRGNVFIENSNYQAYLLEHGAGINFGFGLYDSSAVAKLIRNWNSYNILPMWKIDEPKDYIWNSRVVNNAITQGIIQGESLDKIAKRLTDGLVTKNQNKMLTFARTGMTQAQNAGRLDRLKEAEGMKIKVHKEWMATLDERTRTTHQILDGKKVPINKPFRVDNYEINYPGDPTAHPSMVYNCRCTLVGDLDDYPAEYERYDNINGKPVANMTYDEWKAAKNGTILPEFTQVGIGRARSVEEVNEILNKAGVFTTKADLTGCSLDSAKSVAAAYEQVFSRFPALKGKFRAVDAQPKGMSSNTYAWCYIRNGGKVQVNPHHYDDWQRLVRGYEDDVASGWHPYGTTAESIVTHEIGHAIDGLLAQEGVLGGYTSKGEFRYASSSLKNTIMKRAAKADSNVQASMLWDTKWAVEAHVSRYATKNPQEWFAECFAEYITSANPRTVASEFGKELEKLVSKLQ